MQAIAGRFGGMRKVALLAAVFFAAIAALVAVAPGVAHAASGTFTSNQTINVQRYGEATPYPSNVEVSGLPEDEIVTDVNVTINDYNYYFSGNLRMLLVAPGGQKSLFFYAQLSSDSKDVDLTLDDEATTPLPYSSLDPISSGTYRPNDRTGELPAPAPPGPYGGSLSQFDGAASTNGTWKLYVFDFWDIGAMYGSMGGYSVDITTDLPANLECADGVDNDGDGKTDFTGSDPGCSNPSDDSEDTDRSFVVNSSADAVDANHGDGRCQTETADQCTLRAALQESNANAGVPDRIGFSVDAVTLNIPGANEDAAAKGDLDITDGMTTINGGGVVIGTDADAANNTGFDDRVFHVLGGATATIDEVTVQNGRSNSGFDFFDSGGGILNNGTLNLSRSTVSGNSAGGDVGFGGGICNNGGTLTLTGSTVSGNTATFGGGGVFTARSLTRIENSTITDNAALPDRGSGVAGFDSRTEVSSSIVADNENTDVDFALDDTGTFSSGNYNLVGDGNATGAFNGSGDQINVSDPRLGPLADNGGRTKTHALLAGSLAIDKGNTGLTVDQRGEPRPFDDPNIPPATGGDDSDIGAFEAQEVLNRAPSANDDNPTTNEDTPASVNVLSNDTDDDAGDDLDIASFGQGQNGSVTCDTETGECTYTPDDDFNGADSFTYTASDGKGGGDTATVTITVNAVNDAPSFAKGADQSVAEDAGPQSVPGWTTGISAGPSETQTVTFSATNNNNALFSAQPQIASNGTLTYTPAPNANGSAIVTVKARDDGGTTNGGTDTSAAQTFNITVTPVNDAPTVTVAAGGQCGTNGTSGQINLTVVDVESAARTLTLSATSSDTRLVPNSGLSVGGSGATRTLTVSAAAKVSGTATITVRVSDGQSSGTVPVTVKVGTDSRDTLNGTTGADIIFGKNGDDAITGQDGNDLMCGGNGAGTMSGGSGDDTLDGANGNDVLRGDAGKDTLRGGGGDDTLTGGTEADSFSGGAGTDKATDFNAAEGDTKDATVP